MSSTPGALQAASSAIRRQTETQAAGPLCRHKWFDNDNEIDEVEDIIAGMTLLSNDFFSNISFTELPILILAKGLVRSLEVAA